MSKYDFDNIINRENTGSLKWNKYEGQDIVPLWVADMDFASAPEIIESLQVRLDHKILGYTKPWSEVNQCVLDYLEREHGVKAKEEEIQYSPGMVPVLNLVCQAFCDDAESVMTCSPVYPPFLTAPKLRDRTLVDVPLMVDTSDRWTFDFEAMESAVSSKTRLFILCNPQNPTGRCYTNEELRGVADFCVKHDLILISDEIHCDLVIDSNAKHISFLAEFPELADRTIVMMAPSKTYNLPGLCCAYLHIPSAEIRHKLNRSTAGIFTEINCFGYAGLMSAYQLGEPWRKELISYLEANRKYMYDRLETDCPEIKLRPMEATYLAWMDVRSLNLDDSASYFETHGVGLSNGKDFNGEGYLRLNFGCPRATLEKGVDRIVKAVSELR